MPRFSISAPRPSSFAALPAAVAALDDPGSDHAAVGLLRLAGAASRDVRILLSSAGCDVLFGGLGRYRSALRPLWLGGRAMRARGFLEGPGILRDGLSSWRDGLRATESRLEGQGLTRLQSVQALDCNAVAAAAADRFIRGRINYRFGRRSMKLAGGVHVSGM